MHGGAYPQQAGPCKTGLQKWGFGIRRIIFITDLRGKAYGQIREIAPS